MNNEQPKIETVEKSKSQENQEAQQKIESPEDLSKQIMNESEKEVNSFKNEGVEELAQAEARAEKDGLTVDSEDKEILQELNKEADVAKKELINEITNKDITWSPDSNFPPPLLEQESSVLSPLYYESISAMKERVIEKPELLSEKESSKKFFAEERKKLAEEIRVQRKEQRDRLVALKTDIENSVNNSENIDIKQGDKQYARLVETQSTEADTITERISMEELNEEDASNEKENIGQLIDNSEGIKSIKAKLEEHYAKADAVAKEHFDTLNRSLGHVMKRNNAFIVHKIEERESLRHNANSNVSSEATYQDDIDILLALEPSISASSVTPGEKAALWPGASGFLLGGGQIGEAGDTDIGSHGEKIKKRGGKATSIEKIDEIVGRQDKLSRDVYERFGSHGMNEIVVNNPEIFGFFQHAGKDENGRFWAGSVDATRHLSEEMPNYFGSGPRSANNRKSLKNIVDSYRKRFEVASERKIPLYIMTENREVYECLNVNDNGTIEVGKQLIPEEVATGRAGLPPEKRKEIGEKLLEKKIFKKQETQEEAREIIKSL